MTFHNVIPKDYKIRFLYLKVVIGSVPVGYMEMDATTVVVVTQNNKVDKGA